MTTIDFPAGESVTGIGGEEGWLTTPGHAVHDMSPSEADAARMDAELFFPGSLNRMFKELLVEQAGEINGRKIYVLAGTRDNLPPVQLF